jgi:DNA primase
MLPLFIFTFMAISTLLTCDIKDIPDQWIFEKYCSLSESLIGQRLLIKSPFNPKDKNPSFAIYVGDTGYRFKDFSTGIQGVGIDFIKHYFNLDYHAAVEMILSDYNNSDRAVQTVITPVKYELSDFKLRTWNSVDAKYWLEYNISSDILNYFNVKPLSSYSMKRISETSETQIKIEKELLYVFTRNDGTPYKIYRPNQDNKFLKLSSYIQGTDQIKYHQPNLIITKSLKDIMTLATFGYNAEYLAPESENVLIPQVIMNMHKAKYKAVCTLFDNDDAGRSAAKLYEEKFGIPGVQCISAKDPSDSIKIIGRERTIAELTPLLKQVLKK